MRAARTKRNRTQRALLEAADTVFASKRWPDARMEDVAAAAGVSAATAYNHFPSKHALVGQVYAPLLRPLLVQAERDVATGRPVVEALCDQVTALSRVAFRHRRLTVALWSAVQECTIRATGQVDVDHPLDPRARAPLAEPMRLLVEHGQRTGELRPVPPAADVSALAVGLLLARVVDRAEHGPEAGAGLTLTVVLGILAPELLVDRHPRLAVGA